MRRSDRLFDLVQILRDGRLHRAADLAQASGGVSVRTIWRDMGTLMASGMPIEGERGVGYILRAPTTLPPLMLAASELEALRAGLRLIAAGEDAALARAARSLASKIGAVAPAPVETGREDIFAFTGSTTARAEPHLPILRAAIAGHERLSIAYLDLNDLESHRDIRPLALDLQGQIWVLAAWCEARGGFRAFRLDRIMAIASTGEAFTQEPGQSLADYRALEAQASAQDRALGAGWKDETAVAADHQPKNSAGLGQEHPRNSGSQG
jgi:predicted DNA-binding transcriptional regulator YafY